MTLPAFMQQPTTNARVQSATRVCDPCSGFDEDNEATATVRFVLNGEWHSMDVCPGHERMWLEQFVDWAQCATKLKRQPGTLTHDLAATDSGLLHAGGSTDWPERNLGVPQQQDPRRMRVIPPEPVIKTDVVINRDEPNYMAPVAGEIPLKVIREWGMTDHAYLRMAERSIPIQEVWRALQHRGKAVNTPGNEAGTTVITFGDLCVVVNEQEQAVLTVYRPSTDSDVVAAAAALGGRY